MARRYEMVFATDAGQELTTLSIAHPAEVPSLGDTLVFSADVPYREFRVVNRTFVYDEYSNCKVFVHFRELRLDEVRRFPLKTR